MVHISKWVSLYAILHAYLSTQSERLHIYDRYKNQLLDVRTISIARQPGYRILMEVRQNMHIPVSALPNGWQRLEQDFVPRTATRPMIDIA